MAIDIWWGGLWAVYLWDTLIAWGGWWAPASGCSVFLHPLTGIPLFFSLQYCDNLIGWWWLSDRTWLYFICKKKDTTGPIFKCRCEVKECTTTWRYSIFQHNTIPTCFAIMQSWTCYRSCYCIWCVHFDLNNPQTCNYGYFWCSSLPTSLTWYRLLHYCIWYNWGWDSTSINCVAACTWYPVWFRSYVCCLCSSCCRQWVIY